MPTKESGKWRNAYINTMREVSGLSLENDRLKEENDFLKDQLEKARNYIGIEAWPCPLCIYEKGVFKERCSLHKTIKALESQVEKLRRYGTD